MDYARYKRHAFWWRRRNYCFSTLLNYALSSFVNPGKAKDQAVAYLRNGFWPPILPEEDKYIADSMKGEFFWERYMVLADEGKLTDREPGNEPLTSVELASYSTWFRVHPDRVHGVEKPTTSLAFPVTTKGKIADLTRWLQDFGATKQGESAMKQKGRFSDILKKLKGDPLSGGVHGLRGPGGPGLLASNPLAGLGRETMLLLRSAGEEAARQAIERSRDEEKRASANDSPLLDTTEAMAIYNQGIPEGAIKAWVWYKRSLGVPMTGWESYYLGNSGDQVVTWLEVANVPCNIMDNAYKFLRYGIKGERLGKPTGRSFQIDPNDPETKVLIFRDEEGLRMVYQRNVVERRSKVVIAHEDELESLVKAGHLYYLGGELLPRPKYLFGNMYDRKLELARDMEAIVGRWGQEVYDTHLSAINGATPKMLTITNPERTERPQVQAISPIADSFYISELRAEDADVEIDENGESLVDVFKKWIQRFPSTQFEWSNAGNIVKYYIEAHRVTGKDIDAEEKAEIKGKARDEGELWFAKFLHTALTPEDQAKFDLAWNREYNANASIDYRSVPICFKASRYFKGQPLSIRDAQREGVAFAALAMSHINAFDVGVGKTITAIVTLIQGIVSGQFKRPLLVVPNSTYPKWLGELVGTKETNQVGVLTGTGITVNDWYNLGTDVAGRISLNRKVAENSITVVTFEGARKIGFGQEVQDEMLDELVAILSQSRDEDKSVRDAEVDMQKYQSMIGVGIKETIVDIEVVGFDGLFVDEAHKWKNVFEGVKADEDGKKRYGIQGPTSEIAQKGFFLAMYMQRRYKGNVNFYTATPFTSSPIEIFSMLSMVAYSGLISAGILNIERFFNLFVREQREQVVDYKEQVTYKDVIRGFENRVVLSRHLHNFILFKTGEEVGIRRPCKVTIPKVTEKRDGISRRLPREEAILSYLTMTPKQRAIQIEIVVGLQNSVKGRLDKGKLFRNLNKSLDNAWSPYLVTGLESSLGAPGSAKEFIEESPKLHYVCKCIESVKRWHEERGEDVSGQLIYSNRGNDFFPLIVEYLQDEVGFKTGVKWGKVRVNEVEIIDGGTSQTKKENIIGAFNAGVVKVIIGSSTIREGVDLQKRTTVGYNCYPSWNPTDNVQWDGRFERFGNHFGYVRSVMPLVKDSMDVFVFQKLENKTDMLNNLWYRADRGNVLNLDQLDPNEVKYALITDIEVLTEMLKSGKKEELQRKLDHLNAEYNVFLKFQKIHDSWQSTRNAVIREMRTWSETVGRWPAFTASDETQAEWDKDQRKLAKKHVEFKQDLDALLTSSDQEDEKLYRMEKRWKGIAKHLYNPLWFPDYRELASEVAMAVRTVLKPRGFYIDGNWKELPDQLREEYKAVKAQIEYLDSEDGEAELRQEVVNMKSALDVTAAGVEKRVSDFSRLNYLMAFSQNDVDPRFCELPSEDAAPAPTRTRDREREIRIRAAAKFKMLKLKLELLKS